MAEPQPVFVQGREVSYVELDATVHVQDGAGPSIDLSDLKSINWSSQTTVGKAGGPGRFFTKRTSGRTVYAAACTLYQGGLTSLIKQLGPVAKERGLVDPDDGAILWGQVVCNLGIDFSYLGEDEIRKVRLKEFRFIGDDESSDEGEAAQEAALTLDPMKVTRVIDGEEYAL